MSRSIDICYVDMPEGPRTRIEIDAPYHLFGGLEMSKSFWSLSVWNEIGVEELAVLGHSDPVIFYDWEMMDLLKKEIDIFQKNIGIIDFNTEIKTRWHVHLTYCYNLLTLSTPKNKIPIFTIA